MVIKNPGGKLKPEMSANIILSKETISDAIVLTQDQFVDNVEEQFVFVLQGDIARKKKITLGGRNGNNVIITDGIEAGETLITEGYEFVSDGDKVRVVQ